MESGGWGSPRAWEAVALAAFFALLMLFVTRVIWNIDVFWHIAAGRAFVEHGGIPTTDIFSSIDSDRTWATFQWGYQLLVYGLDQLGGLSLVRASHAIVMWLGFFLFWWGCRRRLGLGPIVSFLLLLLLVVLFSDRIRSRPHIFNFLFWSILFPYLVRGPAALGRRAKMVMFVCVGVWANVHAGGAFLFLIAAATLPVSAFLMRRKGDEAEARTTLSSVTLWYLAGLIPALISPNFITGNVQALVMLGRTEAVIGEWKPSWYFLEVASTPGHYICALLPAALLVLWSGLTVYVLRRKARSEDGACCDTADWPFWKALLTLALIVLAMRSVRFVYISAFAIILILPCLAAGWRSAVKLKPMHGLAGALVVGGILLGMGYHANISCRFDTTCTASLGEVFDSAFGPKDIDTRRFPVQEAELLERTGFSGNVFAQANWGGYLLYRLWPNVRVIADGRGNYDPSVGEDLAKVYDPRLGGDLRNGPLFETIYDGYSPDVVLQPRVWPIQTLSADEPAGTGTFLGYDPSGNRRVQYRPHPRSWRPVPFQGQRVPTIWLNMKSSRAREYYKKLYAGRGRAPVGLKRVH